MLGMPSPTIIKTNRGEIGFPPAGSEPRYYQRECRATDLTPLQHRRWHCDTTINILYEAEYDNIEIFAE